MRTTIIYIVFVSYCQFCACFVGYIGIAPLLCVPLEVCLGGIPSHGHEGEVIEGDFQAVLDFAAFSTGVCIELCYFISALVLCAEDTAFVGCVVCSFCDVGIVASANELIEDDEFAVASEGVLAWDGHASHITAAEEGADKGGVVDIAIRVAKRTVIEHDGGLEVHAHSFHVFCKDALIRQIQSTEHRGVWPSIGIMLQVALIHHAFAIVAEEHLICYHVGAYLQLNAGILFLCVERCTVATDKD